MTEKSLSDRRATGRGRAAVGWLNFSSAQAFRDDEEQRNQENSDHGRRDHAAKDRCSDRVTRGRAGAMRNDQRK